MDLNEVEQLLKKYNINTVEDLEYYLNVDSQTNECIDDPIENKNCVNAKCYEDVFVPDCRKMIEIYNKYFKNEMNSKKQFIELLIKHTSKSNSSIENYMSCKSCNQQIAKDISHSLKITDSDFKKDFCNNLPIKFSYPTLFESDYTTINQFLNKEHKITQENFIPIYSSKDTTMTLDEKRKLFELTHVSRDQLKSNLSDEYNIKGSNEYRMNLALAAFDRNLIDESDHIIESFAGDEVFQTNNKYLQLKAKILSAQQKDKEAIVILERLAELLKPNIDVETNNLLAASIKREAFFEFELYDDVERLKEKLVRSKEMYFSVFILNNDYYPALNYMYLVSMLSYIDQEDNVYINEMKKSFIEIWNKIDHNVYDWWSYIARIEYMIIQEDYDQAMLELQRHYSDVDDLEVSDFNVSSTIRQLKLYSQFCNDDKLNNIIKLLQTKEI